MPCVPDSVCTRIDNQDYTQPSFVPNATTNYASMGYVGFVKLRIPSLNANNLLRVNSCTISAKQSLERGSQIDGRIDGTTYSLGPFLVDGDISMPLVADVDPTAIGNGCPTTNELTVAGGILQNIWCWATARGPQGRLIYNDAILDVRYANDAAFRYDSAIVNTYSISVEQQGIVQANLNIFARARQPAQDIFGSVLNGPTIVDYLSPARILQWSDITINGVGGCSNPLDLFFSQQVRRFSLEINNNAERYFSLNGSLFPTDLNVKKREITGSLTLMGLNDRMRLLAQTNLNRFTEKNELRISAFIGSSTFDIGSGSYQSRDWLSSTTIPPVGSIFAKRLVAVVFQIEELAMTTDILESTINYHAFGSDQFDALAFVESSDCSFPAWR